MKVWGIVGWKNSGKTGLMERLVAAFTARGLRVSTIKHAHHAFDIDQPSKDSHRHREAGATEVLISGGARFALMHELRGADEPSLAELLARLSPVDLVLVEGFKSEPHPKLEAHRGVTGQTLLAADDPSIRAIASDAGARADNRPTFALDDTTAIADFVSGELGL